MEELRAADADDINGIVDRIVSDGERPEAGAPFAWIPITKVQSQVMLASDLTPPSIEAEEPVIYIGDVGAAPTPSPFTLIVPKPRGKLGQKQFMEALPSVVQFAANHLCNSPKRSRSLKICGGLELDPVIGVTMVVLEALFDDQGNYADELAPRGA